MAIRTKCECTTQQLLQHSLLKEFEYYRFLHQCTMLKAKAKQYYIDLEENSATIPDFMRQGLTPEDMANEQIANILSIPDKQQTFNRLYEIAYQEFAEVLD